MPWSLIKTNPSPFNYHALPSHPAWRGEIPRNSPLKLLGMISRQSSCITTQPGALGQLQTNNYYKYIVLSTIYYLPCCKTINSQSGGGGGGVSILLAVVCVRKL